MRQRSQTPTDRRIGCAAVLESYVLRKCAAVMPVALAGCSEMLQQCSRSDSDLSGGVRGMFDVRHAAAYGGAAS
jgi:hypothetical protein